MSSEWRVLTGYVRTATFGRTLGVISHHWQPTDFFPVVFAHALVPIWRHNGIHHGDLNIDIVPILIFQLMYWR